MAHSVTNFECRCPRSGSLVSVVVYCPSIDCNDQRLFDIPACVSGRSFPSAQPRIPSHAFKLPRASCFPPSYLWVPFSSFGDQWTHWFTSIRGGGGGVSIRKMRTNGLVDTHCRSLSDGSGIRTRHGLVTIGMIIECV